MNRDFINLKSGIAERVDKNSELSEQYKRWPTRRSPPAPMMGETPARITGNLNPGEQSEQNSY